jgi:isocitrate dehydrogenase
MASRLIAVAKGDGIGPEIMDACLSIFNKAKVPLSYKVIDMGYDTYKKGFSTGMTPEAQSIVEGCGVLFKGPMMTPKGGGVKSINVRFINTGNCT